MKTNRVLVVLALFAGVTGSIATIEHNVRRSIEWAQGRLNWRSYATDRIAELRANVTIDDFESRLGRPRIITRLSSAGTTSTSFTQRIYQQRGYWVQAVVDNDDTVRNFAVTVCDPKLHPTWKNKNSSGESYKIQLGVTKMTAPAKFEELQFAWSSAGANVPPFAFATSGGTRTNNYQSFAWGTTEVCAKGFPNFTDADYAAMEQHPTNGEEDVAGEDIAAEDISEEGPFALPPPSDAPDELNSLFSRTFVNTFVVFGIYDSIESAQFPLGTDSLTAALLSEDP